MEKSETGSVTVNVYGTVHTIGSVGGDKNTSRIGREFSMEKI